MHTYQFKALNIDGQKVQGTIPANSREQAIYGLKLKHLQPIYLQKKQLSWLQRYHSNIWTIDWTKDMGLFLRKGLSLLESLQVSKLRLTKKQQQFINILLDGLYAGLPLSQIISEHKVFPKLLVGLLKVAESTGQYAEAFEDFALLKKQEIEFFKQLRTSLQYPILLTIMIFTMILGFNEFLFPVVLDFFKSNNFELTNTTIFFLKFAEILKNTLKLFTNIPVLLILSLGIYFSSKITKVKYLLSWLFFKLPFLGNIYLETLQSLYLKSFSILLQRGHHITQAANYSADIIQNDYLKNQSLLVEKAIRIEGKISQVLADFLSLPKPIYNLLLTGETTAQLDIYGDICSQVLKNKCEEKLKKILAWTGPILVSIMGIVMILMVIAVVVPLYDQIARMD